MSDISAISAIQSAIKNVSSTAGTSASAGMQQSLSSSSTVSGPSFTDALEQAFSSGVHTLQAGEAAASQGVTGSQTPFKVVEAVMAAQQTLQEGLSIRDKAVAAYQEISRMTI